MRVAWTLEEIGVPYELVGVSAEEVKQPEHLARHPLGRVPVLERDGAQVYESTGLCIDLADRYPDARLIDRLGSPGRALVYQWAFFAMTELEPPLLEILRHRESDPDRAAAGAASFREGAAVIEQALAGRDWLVGDSLTVADVVTGGVLALANYVGQTAEHAHISAYLERLMSRPTFRRAATATESPFA